MSDEQIVRTLAEFMDYDVLELMWPTGNGQWWYRETGSDEHAPDARILPDWFNSYDALAPVWRKVAGTIGDVARGAMANKACWWYEFTPRDHATSLAEAIAASKEHP